VEIENFPVVDPAAIVIDDGTPAAAALLLVSDTATPVPPAAELSVTVPVAVCPPWIDDESMVSAVIVGAAGAGAGAGDGAAGVEALLLDVLEHAAPAARSRAIGHTGARTIIC